MIGAPVSTNACMWGADATFACPSKKVTIPAPSAHQSRAFETFKAPPQQKPQGGGGGSWGAGYPQQQH